MKELFNMESGKIFHFFEQISKIPRASFFEKEISEYLCDFAKDRKLEYIFDDAYNVVIKKPATAGYENSPTIAIQGHTDMVCEKNKDVEHNFSTDPIKLIYDGDFIKADRTTLGGDNGVGVAMALALLDANNIEHPAIEAIFTSCEEVGMDGATALKTDHLKSTILLNVDSEEEGVFTVGCAGGAKADIEIPLEYELINEDFETYAINILGLIGGHSGIDVNKGKGNSNILLVRALNTISKEMNIYLNKIDGGSKDNAIPREAEAIISINPKDYTILNNKIKELEAIYKAEYANIEPNLKITLDKVEKNQKAFTREKFKNIILAILLLPNGPQSMCADIQKLAESSMNVGVVITEENSVKIILSIRSAVSTRKHLLLEKIELLVDSINGQVEFKGDYPAWEYNKNSVIREKCINIYKEMYGKEPKIEIIHAGLECGIFSEKMPQLDIVSFGPSLYDIHTPDEKASISSIDRVWKFLLKVLKEIR